MPWEKSFDEKEALENAMQVFWEKGYKPASISDLLEGTGLNRGSLYNAFGGKQQLFVKTLLTYDRTRQDMLARLEALDNPKMAIVKFFDNTVANTVADENNKGCFLFNTALEICAHDDEVKNIIFNGVKKIEAFFRRCIEVGQARGEMPAELDPQATAKTLVGLIAAIRVLGRGVYQEESLQMIADQGKRLII